MCGIAGFNWDDKILVRKMTNSIKHRGPDDKGIYTDKNISLGNLRLSILDLSKNGRMPMPNDNHTLWITHNGEVYNFKDVREKLEAKGYSFNSTGDTEVILKAYEEYGVDCLQHFNGMFAFAIWDTIKKTLFMARDRLGIKPLYYYHKNKKFIFASEIKAILQHDIKRELNPRELNYYFALGFIPSANSVFKNIYKLLPGNYLLLKDNKITIKPYWNLDYGKKKKSSIKSLKSGILKHLEGSVEKRLISDVPLGAFLSGGVDSSAVVAMMSRHTDKLKTFSVGFDHPDFDESRYAKIISEKFSTDHYSLNFNADDVLKNLKDITYYVDEPLANTSMIANYLVSKMAKKHVKVVLTGEGGDESFGGYDRYPFFRKIMLGKNIPKIFVNSFMRPITKLNNEMARKTNIFLDYHGLKPYDAYALSWSNFGINNDLGVLAKKQNSNLNQLFKKEFIYKDNMDNALFWDTKNYLTFDILSQADLTAMANSLEGRVPFLDHNFIEFSAKIDPKLKVKGNITKYILKKSLKGVLPKEIIYRKKRGFDSPIEHYFRKELKSHVHDSVFSENIKGTKLFNMDGLKKIFEDHMSKKHNYRQILFSIMIMDSWIENWSPEIAN